jgi:hypothetical protein
LTEPAITTMAATLTSNLRLELERTNNNFNRYIAQGHEWLDTSDGAYRQSMEECVATLAALEHNEQTLEEVRAHNDGIKVSQQADLLRYQQLTQKLREQKKELERQIGVCEQDEEKETQRYEVAHTEYNNLQSRLEQSLNDLTHGVKLYSQTLGLDFHKTQDDAMSFVFTQIDAQAPTKQFSFTMFVDDADSYNLVNIEPASILNTNMHVGGQIQSVHSLARFYVQQLNEDNNIGRFVVKMRQLFVKAATK